MSNVLYLKPGMKVTYCDYSDEGGYIVLREYKPHSDEVLVDQYEEIYPDSDECCPDIEVRYAGRKAWKRRDILKAWNGCHDNVIRNGRYDDVVWKE